MLCETHAKAEEVLKTGVACPACGTVHQILDGEYKVVGEANFYDPEHNINKLLTFECDCGRFFSLFPQEIIWNANHDVYYTGGRVYLTQYDEVQLFDEVQKKIQASLQQWMDRYEAGEKLDPHFPALWMERDLQEAIARYLFNKGLKR